MSELTPITRIESYLDAIVNNGIPPTEDITRIETFLQAIYDNQVCALTPITRIEMFLGKISGQDIVLPEPITRIELYLAAIAGEDVELPENPITRLEMYLAEWADSGDWTTISGAIVEFITQRAHKLKSCVVTLEPQQDLHGYDSPWPAGGGVNKFDGQIEQGALDPSTGEKTPNVERYRSTNFIGVKPSTRYRISVNGTATSANIYSYDANKTFLSNVERPYTNDFTTGADTYFIMFFGTNALNSDKVQIEEGSSVTAWSPYSNICPISGWTGCEVWRTGTNLGIVKNLYVGGSSGLSIGNDGVLICFSAVKGQTYRIYGTSGNRNNLFKFRGNMADIKVGASMSALVSSSNLPYVITADETCIYCYYRNNTWSETIANALIVVVGDEAKTYEPYNGNSYSVTFGETVYGGTPDIVSGEMPVTMGMVDLGALTWYKAKGITTDVVRFYSVDLANIAKKVPNEVIANAICSIFKTVSGNDGFVGRYPNSITIDANGTVSCYPSAEYADATVFKTAMSGVQLVYELATPTETTITPTPITALKGYNAMWSDGGDIEVTVQGTPVELSTQQALNMLLGGAYHNNQTADDVSDEEALEIILGGDQR